MDYPIAIAHHSPSSSISMTFIGVTEFAIFLLTSPTPRAFMKSSKFSEVSILYLPMMGSAEGKGEADPLADFKAVAAGVTSEVDFSGSDWKTRFKIFFLVKF